MSIWSIRYASSHVEVHGLTAPKGRMIIKRCGDHSLPPEIVRYMFDTVQKDVQNYLEGDIEEAGNRCFALLLAQLSEFYRFGIGVDRDSAISNRYLKLAAQRGAVGARKFCLILLEVSDDPKYRLETAEKISWALDCLSIRLPPAVCEKLERSLLDLKDQEAVAGLLGHTISQTMGTVLTLRQGLPDAGHVPASLFQDDHVTLEEVIQNVQAEQGIAAVRSMLADYLQYAVRLGMHDVLRFILLHKNFDLECVQLRDTLIECVRKGDVQGLLIFMECGVEVETLLDNLELHNASLVGSDIMLHLELIMGRRKGARHNESGRYANSKSPSSDS
jgi:hypothetical protein